MHRFCSGWSSDEGGCGELPQVETRGSQSKTSARLRRGGAHSTSLRGGSPLRFASVGTTGRYGCALGGCDGLVFLASRILLSRRAITVRLVSPRMEPWVTAG